MKIKLTSWVCVGSLGLQCFGCGNHDSDPGGGSMAPATFHKFAGTYQTLSAQESPWGSCDEADSAPTEDEWSSFFRLEISADGRDLHRLLCTSETQCVAGDLYYPYFDEVMADGRLRELVINTASSSTDASTECCFTADAWVLEETASSGQVQLTQTISSLCVPLDQAQCTQDEGEKRYDDGTNFECKERTIILAEPVD